MEIVEIDIDGKLISLEAGDLARQAGGAVVVRQGDTMLLVTATMASQAREGIDFFPLTVDYREKTYAAGKIPGNFFRREARPGDLRLQAEVGEGGIGLQLLHDRRGDLPRSLLQGLGQGQRAVGLEVAEFRLAGRSQLGVQPRIGLRESPLHRRPQLGIQGLGQAEHGQCMAGGIRL